MKVYLGADHGGYEIKEHLKKWLEEKDYEVEDCGAFRLDPEDDYPDFVFPVSEKVAQANDDQTRGILICRSGAGVVMGANKVKGVRAAVALDAKSVKHARLDNNINVIGIGADWLNEDQIKEAVSIFLTTPTSTESRHMRRIQKIMDYEKGDQK